LRRETFRLAIVLLYTSGLRRGELVRLTVGDYDPHEQTLLIRASKFHKSRRLPLSRSELAPPDGAAPSDAAARRASAATAACVVKPQSLGADPGKTRSESLTAERKRRRPIRLG
jgi:hypothetical protein